jgi:hypothetical protein
MKNNTPFFGFMLAIIASMAFIVGGGITNALAQGSMTNMNMSSTSTTGSNGANNNATVTRDTVTLLLEGKTLQGKGFWHIYDTTPYLIGKGHMAMQIPCDASSKPAVNVLIGVHPNMKPVQLELLKDLSQPGKLCTYHIDLGSDIPKKILADDIVIQNPTDKPISFPADSGITVGVDEIMPGGEEA